MKDVGLGFRKTKSESELDYSMTPHQYTFFLPHPAPFFPLFPFLLYHSADMGWNTGCLFSHGGFRLSAAKELQDEEEKRFAESKVRYRGRSFNPNPFPPHRCLT